MKKVCTLFCLVMVILCITNTTALAAEPEGKVIDLGDGFYAVETITCSPMTRSRDTTGGSVSNNVYYGSTLIGTATLYATFDISGSAAKVEEANISGTGKNGGAYPGEKAGGSGSPAWARAYSNYTGEKKPPRLPLSCTADGTLK